MTHYKKKKKKSYGKIIISTLVVAALGVCSALIFNSCGKKAENQPDSPTTPDVSQEDTGQNNDIHVPVSYEERVGKEYKTDITDYLQYIEPENKYEYVFLVNPQNTLSSDYIPDDLTDCGYTRKDGRATQKLRLYAAKALQAFLAEGKEYGVRDVTVTSAYRSYEYQDYLFNVYFNNDWASGRFKTKEECEKYTLSYSTKPGTSEHQSGLCCDMHNLPSAEESFGDTAEAAWLADNCYRFGFILRYPKGTTDITGITYEPWHFRFVGRDAATEMHELNLTLDEYVQLKAAEINAAK